jgi:hypothetical protein
MRNQQVTNILETVGLLDKSEESPAEIGNVLGAHLTDNPDDILPTIRLMQVLAYAMNLNDQRFTKHLSQKEILAMAEIGDHLGLE